MTIDRTSSAVPFKKSLELKKHVAIIHSSSRLTLIQRKIANALLYNAYESLMTKDEHTIHIQSLCDLIGYDSKDYRKIKESLVSLIATVYEWNLIDKNDSNKEAIWTASSIIADASINGPMCSYSYSNKMRQLLYRPEFYGRLNMGVLSRFTSSYGLVLYENCIRYQNITQTPWIDLDTFRKLMGVEEEKYLIFRDFKKRVLDKAVQEVNQYSPISITVKFRKENKAVKYLQFLISKQPEELASTSFDNITNIEEKSNETIEIKLKSIYGVSNKKIKDLLSKYEEEYILQKIEIIESSTSFKAGKIKNLSRYLESALEENYMPAKSSLEIISLDSKKKEKNRKIEKQNEEQFIKYKYFQNKEIMSKYQILPDKERALLNKEFEKYLSKTKTLYFDLYIEHGLDHIHVSDYFCSFIRGHKKEMLEQVKTFEEFINSTI